MERALAGRNLAKLGDPREEVMTLDGMQFCYVPPGPFVMGEGEEEHTNECLDYGYWISRYPVSNAQYRFFIEAGGYAEERYWKEALRHGYRTDKGFKGGYDKGEPFDLSNHPVVDVSWYEAVAFCRWMTELFEGRLPKNWGISLPSEAEWEKAARGGLEIPVVIDPPSVLKGFATLVDPRNMKSNTISNRAYPWGDDFNSEQCNVDETGIDGTNANGCFFAGQSPYGAEEMSGNVLEWMRSKHKGYPYNPKDGRENLKNASENDPFVLRGGAFLSESRYARSAFRNGYLPGNRDWFIGFRVAASPFRL